MTANNAELFSRPLFYDALSGEFKPSSDKLQRAHTLGRLAYAAFSKGVPVDGTDATALYVYKPSWAPHVSVTVDCDLDRMDPATQKLYGLYLWSDESGPLDIYDISDSRQAALEISALGGKEARLGIELGEELNLARIQVAQVAQSFFDTLS